MGCHGDILWKAMGLNTVVPRSNALHLTFNLKSCITGYRIHSSLYTVRLKTPVAFIGKIVPHWNTETAEYIGIYFTQKTVTPST